MDTLTSMKVFRQIVESGSFVAAAEHFNFSTANVSKHVMSLEKRLGVRLLNRSSRALSLTEPGRVYFERSKTIVDELETAELELGSFNTTPRGTLRITCPSWFATQRIADTLALHRQTYPDVVVDVSFEDRIVDLIQEGYDLALRVTPHPESLPADQVARPVQVSTGSWQSRFGGCGKSELVGLRECRWKARGTGADGHPLPLNGRRGACCRRGNGISSTTSALLQGSAIQGCLDAGPHRPSCVANDAVHRLR